MSDRRRRLLLAGLAFVYLGLAVWMRRVVLEHPLTRVPLPLADVGLGRSFVVLSDFRMVVATIASHARHLASGSLGLLDTGLCWPLPNALTFGEHMYGAGLLAAVPMALTGEPVLAFNVVTVLTVWIAALAMLAWTRETTGNLAAAAFAAFVFAFAPIRTTNPAHTFVVGNHWTPLVLLAAYRCFARDRWRDGMLLGAAIALQLLESFYQVLALALAGTVYALLLAVAHRDVLVRRLVRLGAGAAIAAGAAGVVFWPYLVARREWGVLQANVTLPVLGNVFERPGLLYPGTAALAAAALALVDRVVRGRRRPDDRVALVLIVLLGAWAAVPGFWLPGYGPVPGLLQIARGWIPGADAVRVPVYVGMVVQLAVAGLAAHGVAAVFRWVPRAGCLVLAVLMTGAVYESLSPAGAQRATGFALAETAIGIGPGPADRVLFTHVPPGAVLDLPFAFDLQGTLERNGQYMLASAYHGRPTPACHNSFTTPLTTEMERLAGAVPDPAALEALAALGVRSLIVHGEYYLGPAAAPELRAGLERANVGGRVRTRLLATSGPHTLWSLAGPEPEVGLTPLVAGAAAAAAPVTAAAGATKLEVVFRNASSRPYRHADPILPTTLVARWERAGVAAREETVRVVLPIALAADQESTRAIPVAVPAEAGDWTLTLAPAAAPERVVARRTVRVGER